MNDIINKAMRLFYVFCILIFSFASEAQLGMPFGPNQPLTRYDIDPYPRRVLMFPLENGAQQLERQIAYSTETTQLTVGGVPFKSTDLRFNGLLPGKCHTISPIYTNPYDRSLVRFCNRGKNPVSPKSSPATISRVSVQGRTAPAKGVLVVGDKQTWRLDVLFTNGRQIVFEFTLDPIPWIDGWLAESNTEAFLIVAGQSGVVGVKQHREYLPTSKEGFWGASFPIRPQLYILKLSVQEPTYTRETVLGIKSRTYLDGLTNLPRLTDRPTLLNKVYTTYQEHIELQMKDKGGRLFKSQVIKLDPGKLNVASVTSEAPGESKRQIKSSIPIYRGYNTETSLRGSLLATADSKIIFAGDGSIFHFPSRLWSPATADQGYDINRFAWVVRGYTGIIQFNSVDIQNITTDSPPVLSQIQAEARVHWNQGIWQRDELFGLIFAANQTSLLDATGSFLGMGAYWARTMPKTFDDLFNWIPIWRYPKYVDMDVLWLPMSTEFKISPAPVISVNFHGKLFFSSRVYFEAGFGFRSYLLYNSAGFRRGTASIYGTGGWGIMF